MKRWLPAALLAAFACSASGCAKWNSAYLSVKDKIANFGKPQIEEQVIFDEIGIVVTATALKLSEEGFFPSLLLRVENTGDGDYLMNAKDCWIDGVTIEPMLSLRIPPQKSVEGEMGAACLSLDLEKGTTLQRWGFRLAFLDPDTMVEEYQSHPITIATNASDPMTVDIVEGGSLAMDEEGIKAYFSLAADPKSFWGSSLKVCFLNETSSDLELEITGWKVNGKEVEAVYSAAALAGTKSYDEVSFSQSSFAEQGITGLGTLSCEIKALNTVSGETAAESEVKALTFPKQAQASKEGPNPFRWLNSLLRRAGGGE